MPIEGFVLFCWLCYLDLLVMFSLCLFVWFSSPLLCFCLERGLNTNLRQRAVLQRQFTCLLFSIFSCSGVLSYCLCCIRPLVIKQTRAVSTTPCHHHSCHHIITITITITITTTITITITTITITITIITITITTTITNNNNNNGNGKMGNRN